MQNTLELTFSRAQSTPDPDSPEAEKIGGQIGYVSVDGGILKVEFSEVWEVFVVATGE